MTGLTLILQRIVFFLFTALSICSCSVQARQNVKQKGILQNEDIGGLLARPTFLLATAQEAEVGEESNIV